VANTKEQEQASLTAFYYAIEKGATLDLNTDGLEYLKTLGPTKMSVSDELKLAIYQVYPRCPQSWYETFLKQARALLGFLGHKEGTTDTSYKYARWGKNGQSEPVPTIPPNKRTDVADLIYSYFTPAQKALFGTGDVSDSWNPMDVYIVKARDEQSILDTIHCCIKGQIGPDSRDSAEMEIASINRYMAYLAREHMLVPISLKESDTGRITLKETNMKKYVTDIPHSQGKLDTPLTTWLAISDTKGSKGSADFTSNSLTFNAFFNEGSVPIRYKYESKIGSLQNHATEPRNLVPGTRTNWVPANARNGSIPVPKMALIVHEYSGDKINHMIPMANESFDKKHIDYWVDELTNLRRFNSQFVKFEFGPMTFKVGSRKLNNPTPREWMEAAANEDNKVTKKTGKDFPLRFRSKLRLLRYMKMFVNATKGPKDDGVPIALSKLIATLFYSSAKINMTQEDLSGPFIKIQ
tara:strand:+ start:49 stop:1446 length:1398 start_codon:yes stop_codon:yes gene_type:complete